MCEAAGLSRRRNKHFSIKVSFMAGNPSFRLEYLAGVDHPADVLTKPLSQAAFKKHVGKMMGDDSSWGEGAAARHERVWGVFNDEGNKEEDLIESESDDGEEEAAAAEPEAAVNQSSCSAQEAAPAGRWDWIEDEDERAGATWGWGSPAPEPELEESGLEEPAGWGFGSPQSENECAGERTEDVFRDWM